MVNAFMEQNTRLSPNADEVGIDIRAIKKRFMAVNRERLHRCQESLRWKQRDFLDLLPFLFHVNHPMLPGYISKTTPAGIMDYSPTNSTLDAAKRFTKTYTFKKRALLTYNINSMFLIGSSGTIAHSDKSDFDIWICYRNDLNEEQIISLEKKANAIQQWAHTLDLDVHFFLMDAEKFKHGEVIDLSSESSGSAQHHLLLEEFYRTSLLVAGKYPAWWLVPPEAEHRYDEYLNELITKRFVPAHEMIDFGGLHQIPAEEFFGAALWQVYKGIDSPYKAVLKIMLMETYAREYPNIDLLSTRYKRRIYEGKTNLDQLDPYIMLVRKLQEYLQSRNEEQRLDLVRRCFYFKVDMPMGTLKPAAENIWRHELMHSFLRNWHWEKSYLEILDGRESWKIQRVLKERKILVDELTNSYLFLSNFARQNTQLIKISQQDLNILGRKLYAAFERKAGKVEIVNRGISPNLAEANLLLRQNTGQDGSELWTLFHGEVGMEVDTNDHLKKSNSAVRLLAWCHFNKLINRRTIVALRTTTNNLEIKEVREIIKCLNDYYPDGNIKPVKISELAEGPTIDSYHIFINVGIDPMSDLNQIGGAIISSKNDALKYSGFFLNLALSFEVAIINNWQEVFTYRYQGVNGLLECLGEYLKTTPRDPEQGPLPTAAAHCFNNNHGTSIANRISELFNDVGVFFNSHESKTESQYVLAVQQSFYVLNRHDDSTRHVYMENYGDLLSYLSRARNNFTHTHIDRHALAETCLPLIFKHNQENTIQFFYQKKNNHIEVYILDENGTLVTQRLKSASEDALISHYHAFFTSITKRVFFLNRQQNYNCQSMEVSYHQITRERNGEYQLTQPQPGSTDSTTEYFNIQVIGNVDNARTTFTIYCDDREFSSYEYGAGLFAEVARYILRKRRDGSHYPIYITDIDLAPSLIDKSSNRISTANYLIYKKRIEDKLNQELAQI